MLHCASPRERGKTVARGLASSWTCATYTRNAEEHQAGIKLDYRFEADITNAPGHNKFHPKGGVSGTPRDGGFS